MKTFVFIPNNFFTNIDIGLPNVALERSVIQLKSLWLANVRYGEP